MVIIFVNDKYSCVTLGHWGKVSGKTYFLKRFQIGTHFSLCRQEKERMDRRKCKTQ